MTEINVKTALLFIAQIIVPIVKLHILLIA